MNPTKKTIAIATGLTVFLGILVGGVFYRVGKNAGLTEGLEREWTIAVRQHEIDEEHQKTVDVLISHADRCHAEIVRLTPREPPVEASLFRGGGGLGSGIRDGRDAVAGASELVADAQRILADLEHGATGVELVVGPIVLGPWTIAERALGPFTIPAIPLHFKLEKK